jgi:hypothetical protein
MSGGAVSRSGRELVAAEFELLVLVASSTVGDVEAVALLSGFVLKHAVTAAASNQAQ